jgi:redox-sensitive bicupin YhaK (pirin superfamily)
MESGNLRSITSRQLGAAHGPITRLISPEGLGQELKPFVFLDFFSASITPGFGFAIHPHSGIATLTWQPGCDVRYSDTTGKSGLLRAGGLEWMNAGRGAWHQGWLQGSGPAIGFQLWVPMPPGVEGGAALGQYVPPEDVPSIAIPGGNVKVLLGSMEHGSDRAHSPIESHQDMNYLVVSLDAHQQWHYEPPRAHTVAWAFAFDGKPFIQNVATRRELIVFEGSGAIEMRASSTPASILLGTAKPHPFPLILGASSVHTSADALAKGVAEIDRIGQILKASPIQ